MSALPRLFQLILKILAINLAVMLLMRLGFWIYFNNPADPIATQSLLTAFYIGAKFDLRLALLIVLPLFLLGWIKYLGPFHFRLLRWLWILYFTLMGAALIFFYFTDFGHYAYLQRRVDSTVFRFLDNFDISMQMVTDTYPVVTLGIALAVVVILYMLLLHRWCRSLSLSGDTPLAWKHKAWIAPLSLLLVLFGLYGKFSYYPLRWSDAFFSPHVFASAVTANPVLYFANTLKNKHVTFDREKTAHYYPLLADKLGVQNSDPASLNFTRKINTRQRLPGQPNVVLVFLESFAAHKTSTFGNPLKSTPYFDQLAAQGVLFTNYYTPTTGTARSVFTAVTGLADVELHKTSSRNPLVVNQHTIINDFTAYKKFYFIGGSASWGNIRGVLSHNIADLKLYEEGDYASPRMDVWGISDLHLFLEADKVLAQQDKPFFAIIQTSGNHRPYNIPEDSHGFSKRDIDSKKLNQYGFFNIDEFNAFSFMDHSIKVFMEQARSQPYFENTIFFFFGDHGITGYAGDHSKPFLTQLRLNELHTPLLIYAPKYFPKARRIDKIASEVDLLPTVAGLITDSYTNTTLGRDLFDTRFDDKRYAFTFIYESNPILGVLNDKYYLTTSKDGADTKLFDIHSATPRNNILKQKPEIAQAMKELCLGIYETDKYLLHHNKSLSHSLADSK